MKHFSFASQIKNKKGAAMLIEIFCQFKQGRNNIPPSQKEKCPCSCFTNKQETFFVIDLSRCCFYNFIPHERGQIDTLQFHPNPEQQERAKAFGGGACLSEIERARVPDGESSHICAEVWLHGWRKEGNIDTTLFRDGPAGYRKLHPEKSSGIIEKVCHHPFRGGSKEKNQDTKG